jgi:cyanophycin synthetase
LTAMQRDIPVSVQSGVLQLGWGAQAERMDSSFTGRTSNIAARLARNKLLTSQWLSKARIPVPRQAVATEWNQAQQFARQLNWPVVIKPLDRDQGLGVVAGINSEAMLKSAFEMALKYSSRAVIVEKHIDGNDYRMLVVGGKLFMATHRIPGGVIGDGLLSVTQLVERVNGDPRRGIGKRSLLMRLELDDEAQHCLEEQGLTREIIPEAGRFVRLRRTANISRGGTAVDVTAMVHPDNRSVAERAARIIGLDIAGVDFLCPDISRSWREAGGAICEVNAQPGFRPHWLSDPGRDINGEVVDWLFRDKTPRIPTVAITGTNGKSTVARMLHHIWMTSGRIAGVCTTQGVWVGHELVSDHNLSGFPGAKILLDDPVVEVAVIEMPRKGLIRFGHACDRYDVAVLLNVQDDHIGVDGINSLEEMAWLKAEVLERASRAIVVNADDPLCLAMRSRTGAPRHILVSRNAQTPALRMHLDEGGHGVFVQLHYGHPWLVFAEGAVQTPLMPLADIPATMNGLLRFNEFNALFAAALAWAGGVSSDNIRAALSTFANTPAQNVGRCNFIEGFPFQLLLDYAHNPDGVPEVCEFAAKLPVYGRRRLLSLTLGNRHREHLDAIAPVLARNFEMFLLGCDADCVRKSADYASDDPIATMLNASREALLVRGVPPETIEIERDYALAIKRALADACPGDLLVMLAEPWITLPIIEAAKHE